MEDKLDETYQEYLGEKLDLIFHGASGKKVKNQFSIAKKYNVLKQEKVFGHPELERVEKRSKDTFGVRGPNGYGLISRDGKILCEANYSYIRDFSDGYAVIMRDNSNQSNYIDKNGKLLSDEWFDNAHDFKNGYGHVVKNGKSNFIDKNGNLLSKTWYNYEFANICKSGYIIVIKGRKKNMIDQSGNLLFNEWYDEVYDFCGGFALVFNPNSYNLIDEKGHLFSDKWYREIKSLGNGWVSLVNEKSERIYLDKNGKVLKNVNYDEIYSFSDGVAIVRKNKKCNLIDEKGNLLSNEWFDNLYWYNGVYIAKKNDKEAIVDYKGKLLTKKWYDEISKKLWCDYFIVFDNGKYNILKSNYEPVSNLWFNRIQYTYKDEFVAVYYGKYYIYDLNGKLVNAIGFEDIDPDKDDHHDFFIAKQSGKWYVFDRTATKQHQNGFDKIVKLMDNYCIVMNNGLYAIADLYGNVLSKWQETKPNFREISSNYIKYENGKIECMHINLGNYQAKKTIFGYVCKSKDDAFKVKYQPIQIYGKYVLCQNKDSIILFDRSTNSYKELGNINNVEYDENFIIDYLNGVVYLMYEDQMIDITKYYMEHLLYANEVNITSGVKDIISKNDFFIGNESEIRARWEKEKEKNKKIRLVQEQKVTLDKVNALKKAKEQKEAEEEEMQKEALIKLSESLDVLEKLEGKKNFVHRVKVGNLFVEVEDHLEINPMYLSDPRLLKHIDLSFESFKNVKISGIDFRGCNIQLNPQEVYGKDLSNCNFEGLHIEPFMDFTGVNICGTRFSDDDDIKTQFYGNGTFELAIYDENTTYNGIPFTVIYGKKEEHSK